MKTWTLWQLIVACSLSQAEPEQAGHVEDVLYRIIMATSQGNPLWVGDVQSQSSFAPSTHEEAVEITHTLLQRGGRTHVGLAALAPETMRRWRIGPAQALDACTNIGIASMALEARLGPRTQRDEDELHVQLADYFVPGDPDRLEAMGMGAKVLTIRPVDVSTQARSAQPKAAPRYPARQKMFFGEGTPTPEAPAPTKWDLPEAPAARDPKTEATMRTSNHGHEPTHPHEPTTRGGRR